MFYSFQTDSHQKTNFHFLRDLLVDICKEIKHYKVELDWGFLGSSGNRPLLEHMLGQSNKADVFIGDVTYTAEHNSHEFRTYKNLLGYEYKRIKTEGNVKMYPNGNVLLETGYSWAKKEYSRTLLIMNTAYGHPDSVPLPADMIHIERPILYNLSEDKLTDNQYLKDLRLKLGGTLKSKIIKAIEHERNHLRQSFLPIHHFEEWPSKKYVTPFAVSAFLKRTIESYRSILETPGTEITLVGPKSSGKTRLSYELFKKNRPYFGSHPCIKKLYYYNFLFGSFASIHMPLIEMKKKNQHFVIILDNCENKHIKMVQEVLNESKISVFFIQET